jgi:hypothetical protein
MEFKKIHEVFKPHVFFKCVERILIKVAFY